MTAPTEAEIRATFRERVDRWPTDNPVQKLRAAIEDFGDFMHGPAYEVLESPDARGIDDLDVPGDVWSRDLRPSEAVALDSYWREAVEQATSDARTAIEAVFVREALRFAAEYPDAPRARKPQPIPA